jgi:mono/diheme cytochrome c family protein
MLTQLAFLATYAQPLLTDPLARGLTVWRELLCGEHGSTTHVAFTTNSVDITAPRRAQYAQIYAQQPAPGACAACHGSFDPLGFAFENYDMIGGYRSVDNGDPIDASGTTVTPAGTTISFKNAVELVDALAVNDEVKWCVTRQWFRFVLGRMESTADLGSMQLAYRAGAAVPGFSVREMLSSLVQTQAFRFRALSAGEM